MNCQQMGHYKSRCPNPLVPEDEGDGGYGGGGADNGGYGDGADTGGFDPASEPSANNGGDDWGTGAATASGW